MKIICCLGLAIFQLICSASEIKIGLFHGRNIESVVITVIDGTYKLQANNTSIGTFQKNAIFLIDQLNSKLYIHDATDTHGPFDEFSFIPLTAECIFSVKPVFPALAGKESGNRLDVTLDEGFVKLVNTIDMEAYLPGTVESEGGHRALPEYYKAQAVLARTFAVKNYLRHAHEGFNICDDVHCQAFNGKSRMNKSIYDAVKFTEGMILTDMAGDPIITAYHSCCGGRTASASTEWNRDLDYLVPVNDPFCNDSKNRNWTVPVSRNEWNEFLLKAGYDENIEIRFYEADRRKYLDENNGLALTAIRRRFNLKSSWFNVKYEGTQVVFHGHGYGHGLGMCQEGAMEMATVGFTYMDILMFYYRGVRIRNEGVRERGSELLKQ